MLQESDLFLLTFVGVELGWELIFMHLVKIGIADGKNVCGFLNFLIKVVVLWIYEFIQWNPILLYLTDSCEILLLLTFLRRKIWEYTI